tara:strand:- start:9520 stop:10185 length:666 start_codon:yes stop_codon:yes gene_type:complete
MQNSEEFKNQTLFRFGFVKKIFENSFYDQLYSNYPKLENFDDGSDMSKNQLKLDWGENSNQKETQNIHMPGSDAVVSGSDSRFSKEWNEFKQYAETEEFVQGWRDFSGIPVNRLRVFRFLAYRKGGFQLPHIHNVGPSTLVLMFYFSKNWNEGEAGGTYMASELDESKIIFEPYDLDNSMALFHDGPNSVHGTRLITKNSERRALQITLEGWSKENGWTGS